MGANDRLMRGYIPKELVEDATTWEFEPLAGRAAAPSKTGTERLLSERERRAFERGRAQGHAEGLAQAAAQRASHAQQLDQALNALRARFTQLESEGADAALALALTIAQHIVRREVSVQRDAVLPALREAMTALVDQQTHPRILMNPQDLALIREDLNADGLFKGCHFIADASIDKGGCRVETPKGEIDARLSTRWQHVLDALGVCTPQLATENPPSDQG